MKKLFSLIAFCFLTLPLFSQDAANWLASLPQTKDYVQSELPVTTGAALMRTPARFRPGRLLLCSMTPDRD